MISNIAFLSTTASGAATTAPLVTAGAAVLTNDTPMTGDLLAQNIPAPATPTIGSTRIYVDNVAKVLSAINDTGVISRTVVPATGAAGQFMTGIGATGVCTFSTPGALPRNYIDGFIVTNDGTSPNTVLDVGAGQAVDSTNIVAINSSATFTKSTGGSWVAGSGAFGMGIGLTISASTWYFAYAIINNGAFDVYYDTSPTAANAPAGTTAFRLIYPFKTDGSSHILPVSQNPSDPDEFMWATATLDVNNASVPTSVTALALNVPSGIIVNAVFFCTLDIAASTDLWMGFSPVTVDSASLPVILTGNLIGSITAGDAYASGQFNIRTNTSQQIGVNTAKAGGGACTYSIVTVGWIWRRGRQ